MDRSGWDEACMNMVRELGKRSACRYFKIGCIFSGPEKIIVATGYNGPPRDFPHCVDVGCSKDLNNWCRGGHAEINAISFCSGSPYKTLFLSTCYVHVCPCKDCMLTLANLKVARVVYEIEYKRRVRNGNGIVKPKPDNALEVARIAGIQVEKWNPETKLTTVILEGKMKEKGERRE